MRISSVVLTRNSAKTLPQCLKSLSWCDECVIIDDESTDDTLKHAAKAGARVISRPLNGDFAAQRNAALEYVKNDWVLYVDSDEVVSPETRDAIRNAEETFPPDCTHARIRRRDHFLGAVVCRGEVADAAFTGIVRLVKRGTGNWVGTVHETWHAAYGAQATLSGFLEHFPHQTLTEFILEVNHYSTLRAGELFREGKQFRLGECILYPAGKFCYTYLIRGGFRDGVAGFIYSFLMSFHSFLVRAKLYQLHFYAQTRC
ncbi:MAG: glycosyltransferase family 2 protein [Patescibacteria group bacterium]|nr:glycosyltransferase family 2 protein [Patescibacteria group bacterium]